MLRLALVIACGLAAACAAERPPVATKAPAKKVAPAGKKLSAAEVRERELTKALDKARVKVTAPRELAKVEARITVELAQLRFQRGDERAAFEAIDTAVRAAWFSEDAELHDAVSRAEFHLKRTAALVAASRGEHAKSLRIFDELALGRERTSEERAMISGDRLLVLEQRGEDSVGAEVDLAGLLGALDRIYGLSSLLQNPVVHDAVSIRVGAEGEAGAVPLGDPRATLVSDPPEYSALEKKHSDAELPAADEAPAVETGTIDHQVVSKMITMNRRSIEDCYDRSLRGGNRLSGKLEIDIEVEPSGTVSDADVLSTEFHGTELARCISSAIRRWKFPPIVEAKRMTVPFVLGRAM